MTYKLVFMFLFYQFISSVVLALDVTKLPGNISADPSDIKAASLDFGNISHIQSSAVLYPNSAYDIVHLVKKAYRSAKGFNVSARGNGHSTNGQSQVANGIVIDMSGTKAKLIRSEPVMSSSGPYVDVWGGDLWINVLNWTLRYGLTPKSWTNYLDLTVGGTLSVAGIGGQSYNHGPQVSNVYELDVVTGKGKLVTCSQKKNSDLFYGVLGGLGQFGIITRARVALEKAPERVFQIEAVYHDFAVFTKDQEYLASLCEKPASEKFNVVLGFVNIVDGVISYKLEVGKYFSKSNEEAVIKEIDALLAKLDYDPSSLTQTDISYVSFLDWLRPVIVDGRKAGAWDVPHPWLDLFIPKSRISDFNEGVFKGILGNSTHGTLTVYPLNRNKWDSRTSVIIPDEDIFYAVLFLRAAIDTGAGTEAATEFIVNQNNEILDFCKKSEIKMKWYIPHYNTKEDWLDHYGDKWDSFRNKKKKFDPKHLLATGQKIFM